MTKKPSIYEGRAYAFFDCDASLRAVSRKVRNLKSKLPYQTRSKLGLTLEGMPNFIRTSKDAQLLQIIENTDIGPTFYSKAKKLKEQMKPTRIKDYRYALTAKYASGTNNDAGDALTYIMGGINAAYGNDILFRGEIVGKAPNGNYVPWA